MAEDQFQSSGGNWWDSARSNMRYESTTGVVASQSSSSGITNIGGGGGGGGGGNNNFANWQQQDHVAAAAEHMKPTRSTTMDSSGGSSVVFHHDPHKLHPPDATCSDPNLHMMGLGLSSPSLDWDQPSLLRGGGGEKGAENSFRSLVQDNLGSSSSSAARTNFQQDHQGLSPQVHQQWRDPPTTTNNNNNNNNRGGFSLDQNQFSPQYSSGDSTVTSQQGLHHHHHHHPSSSPFQNIDSSALYATPSSILMQGLLVPENNSPHQQANNSMNFPFPSISYGLSSSSNDLVPNSSWPNKATPQFSRGSAPPPNNNQLHFTNNAPFWNASEASTMKDVRSMSFFPSLQPPFSTTTPNFDVQSKNMSEVRDSGGGVKKSGSEQTPKRPRSETPSPLPAFKVRKEKMGDRITALQQLVSPFGKTDTASVLSEAIEYIKFLHEQVTVLSTPYMKSGAPMQIQQSSGKSKEGEGPKQDLRSRGLCLVPVSSTFPVTHETTVDFWTPTFGGGSR